MALCVFFSSVSGNLEMKKRQQRIFDVLESKKIDFEAVDISQKAENKDLMRELAEDPKALPPQLCKGRSYCGNFEAFENAVEAEALEEFLKL